jgi:hypothetical protein
LVENVAELGPRTGILPVSFFPDFGDRLEACPTLAATFFAMQKSLRRKIGGVNSVFRYELHGLSRIRIAQSLFPNILPV